MVLISFNGLAMILVFSSLSMTCLVHLRICMILSPARKEVGKRLASLQARVVHHFEQKIGCSLVRSFLSGCRWLIPVLFKPWPCRRGTTLNFAFPLDMRYFRHCMVVLCFQAFLLSFCSVFAEFPCYLLPDF